MSLNSSIVKWFHQTELDAIYLWALSLEVEFLVIMFNVDMKYLILH